MYWLCALNICWTVCGSVFPKISQIFQMLWFTEQGYLPLPLEFVCINFLPYCIIKNIKHNVLYWSLCAAQIGLDFHFLPTALPLLGEHQPSPNCWNCGPCQSLSFPYPYPKPFAELLSDLGRCLLKTGPFCLPQQTYLLGGTTCWFYCQLQCQ